MFLFLTQMLSSCRGESKTNTMRTWVSLSSTLSRLQLFNQHIQVQGHQEGYDFPAIFPQFASTESLASSSDTDRSPTLHTCLSLRRHPLRQEQSCLVTGHSPEMSTPRMRITTRRLYAHLSWSLNPVAWIVQNNNFLKVFSNFKGGRHLIFLINFFTKWLCSCACWKGNFLSFSKLIQLFPVLSMRSCLTYFQKTNKNTQWIREGKNCFLWRWQKLRDSKNPQ